MSLGKEIKKIENYSREDKIKFYENAFSLIELGNTTIYEYKKLFGLDDVEDKNILREVKKVLEELSFNYRSLFHTGHLPENYQKNQVTIRENITKEIKRIISYTATINNLPISIGYLDKKTSANIIYNIEKSDIQAGVYEVYKNNEYICARTVKESILRQIKQISDKDSLLEEYQTLSDEEKQKISEMANVIPCNISGLPKTMIVKTSTESYDSPISYKIKPKRRIKGEGIGRPTPRENSN